MCTFGSSPPTRRPCAVLGCPAPCPSRGTSPQPTRLAPGPRFHTQLRPRRSGPVEAFGLPPPHGRVRTGHQGGGGLSALNTPCSVSTTPVPCLPPLVPYLPRFVPCLPPPSLPPPRWPVPTPRPNRRLWRNGSLAACVPLSTIEGQGTRTQKFASFFEPFSLFLAALRPMDVVPPGTVG